MTAALEGSVWSAARPCHTLLPGKTRYPLYRRLCGPPGRPGRAENFFPTGIRSRTVQPVVSHYTDWAIGPTKWTYNTSFKIRGVFLAGLECLHRVCIPHSLLYLVYSRLSSRGWNDHCPPASVRFRERGFIPPFPIRLHDFVIKYKDSYNLLTNMP